MDNNKEEVDDIEYEDVVVSFIGDDGEEEMLYRQEMIIPVGDEQFALLVGIVPNDEKMTYADDEDNVIIAKIVKDENGEDEYIDPTDEEFARVQKVYDAMMDEMEKNG